MLLPGFRMQLVLWESKPGTLAFSLGPEGKHFPLSPLPCYLQSCYPSASSTMKSMKKKAGSSAPRSQYSARGRVEQEASAAPQRHSSPCHPCLAPHAGPWSPCRGTWSVPGQHCGVGMVLQTATQLEKGRDEKLEETRGPPAAPN